MKKVVLTIIPLIISAAILSSCNIQKNENANNTNTTVKIASLKGPTTMGMVKLMQDNEDGQTQNNYDVTMHGTADEIVTGIVNGTIDVANVPANLASVLYNKTDGGIKVCAVNTLGVLYMVETGESVYSVSDLKGKTIYSTGKGTTPEYVLNYILNKNGINPETDVTIEFKSEATEVASMLASSENAIALLPQPFATVAQMQNENIRICLDMTAEWDKVSDNKLITGVVIARNDYIDNNTNQFETFMAEYSSSVEFVNANNESASTLIDKYDIIKKAPALKALPYCNITFVKGDNMQKYVSNYLEVLMEQDPASIGGKLPDENFYFKSK